MLRNITGHLQKIENGQQKKYLLAVSGGVDSIVLAYVFKELKRDFALAHCNFKLRGKESDDDQKFVENFAQKHQIPLFIEVCDLSKTQENTQLTARNARYAWFEKLLDKHNFDYLVTAHHLNDSIESFFINMLRGTGLKGLTGIHNTGKTIRPMRNITRPEIERFAFENDLKWREDSSNASVKYQRNFIRHQIIPKLKELKPDFEKIMLKNFEHLQQNQNLAEDWFQNVARQIIKTEKNREIVYPEDLKRQKHRELFLYQWLSPYGFSDWKNINNLIDNAQNGKYLIRENYRLSKNNDRLILEKIELPEKTQSYLITKRQSLIEEPIRLSISHLDINEAKSAYKEASKQEVYLDSNAVKFPLTIRKWQAGDYFYPLGMKGKKKLSDYFKDEKMSLSEKEKIWLICNAENSILWIVGKRPDNRFIITDKTKKVLHIKIS